MEPVSVLWSCGLLCLGYMTVKLGKVSLFGEELLHYMPVLVRYRDCENYSTVEIDGIEVGRVER